MNEWRYSSEVSRCMIAAFRILYRGLSSDVQAAIRYARAWEGR